MNSVLIRFSLVVIGLGAASPANALSLEGAFASQLLRAHVGTKIESLRQRFDRARQAREICALQIAKGSAPVECYELLGIERAWKVLDETRYRSKRRRLDAECTRAALRLDVPENSESREHLSPECRSRVNEARSIRRYRRANLGWSGD